MHNRQSGAAHVPIMFFLLLLVMFIGAVVFAFTTHTKNADLQRKYAEAIADRDAVGKKELLVSHYIEDIGTVIAKPGKYEGRQGQGGVYGDAALAYPGLMNPAEVKKVLDDNLASAGLSAASGLENVLSSMVTKIQQLERRAQDAEAARDKALQETSEINKKFQAAATEASTKANEFRTTLERANADYTAANANRQQTLDQLTVNLQQKNDELSAEKERAAAEKKELERQVARHQMHSSALIEKDAMRKPADAADGKVLSAKNGIPTAFIDLGRKDMLQPGTVFRIKSPGSDKIKGYATVTRVEDESAEVSLNNFADPIGDYARAGDLLYNDLYTPRVTRTIYLMGRFEKPYAKDDIAKLLQRLGNRVVTKMQPGVDTVILGNNPVNEAQDGFSAIEESPEFKLASELRVEFAPLATIRDLIKL